MAAKLITEGDLFYKEAVDAINQAKRRIHLTMYIFNDDEAGKLFQQALIKKAGEGVKVHLIYDRVGSMATSSSFFDALIKAGVQVYAYQPSPFSSRREHTTQKASSYLAFRWLQLLLSWLRLFLFRRNHRKLLIVDRKIAFTGGFNIMNKCSKANTGQARWLDIMVAIDEPLLVRQLDRVFYDALRRARLLRIDAITWQRKKSREAICYSKKKSAMLFLRRPFIQKRIVTLGIATAIKRFALHGKKRFYLVVPYFIPLRSLLRILKKRARAGVDVRVYLSLESDQPAINQLSHFMARKLFKNKVPVYLYHGRTKTTQTNRFNHAKAILVDNWAAIGSSNIDSRSLTLNLENMVFYHKPGFLTDFESFFHQIESQSFLASEEDLRSGFWAFVLYPFRRFL